MGRRLAGHWRRRQLEAIVYESRRSSLEHLEQLELALEPRAIAPDVLANLRAVLRESQLPQREFATWALGCNEYTLTRYLRGEKIPNDRRAFLSRLERVTLHGDRVVIVVRAGSVRRLPQWRRPRSPT